MSQEKFTASITTGYTCKGDYITLGGAMLDGKAVPGVQVNIPLRTLNRHGLIAGATGTGKTKTLQGIAEALSAKGVPCLLMDIKGDLSGLAAAGSSNPKIEERHTAIGLPWTAHAFPVEMLTLSGEKGTRLRATVSEFGPVLFSRILGLNDTQGGVVSLVFKYCDDHNMPLLDLRDFKKTLHYLTNEGKKEIEADYGRISTASSSTILRKILELEQQDADVFFGEISFDPEDLLRVDENGYGYLSILRLTDIQDKPKMFSTFMLNLLAEIYATFPEEGDLDQPKLVLFIDEAHLIFNEASKALLEQIETIVRLIRSKGVGVIFCTQQPTDVPENVLAQLGLKVQHGLRAFTAKDRRMIKTVSENYPLSDFYKTDELLTHLGIGEALITGLNEKGIPTPLVHTLLCAPRSRMDILTAEELDTVVQQSQIAKHYNQVIDSVSAHEMLTEKLNDSRQLSVGSKQQRAEPVKASAVEGQQSAVDNRQRRAEPVEASAVEGQQSAVDSRQRRAEPVEASAVGSDAQSSSKRRQSDTVAENEEPEKPLPGKRKTEKEERSVVEEVADSTVGRQVMRTVARELTRGLLGVLGISSTRRRKSKWF